MKNQTNLNTYYRFEIYTVCPITKTMGWDIEIVGVKANNYKEAKEKLKNYPLFDCIITNEGYEQLKENSNFIKYNYRCLNYTIV
jgi:UDP-N-acetyl-D-mannosaminuronic acid transferase (WecB/TagA/CpsF family)